MPTGYVAGHDAELAKRLARSATNDPVGQMKGSLAENYSGMLSLLNRGTSALTPMASYEDLQGYSGAEELGEYAETQPQGATRVAADLLTPDFWDLIPGMKIAAGMAGAALSPKMIDKLIDMIDPMIRKIMKKDPGIDYQTARKMAETSVERVIRRGDPMEGGREALTALARKILDKNPNLSPAEAIQAAKRTTASVDPRDLSTGRLDPRDPNAAPRIRAEGKQEKAYSPKDEYDPEIKKGYTTRRDRFGEGQGVESTDVRDDSWKHRARGAQLEQLSGQKAEFKDVYDPKTKTWSKVKTKPGITGMAGRRQKEPGIGGDLKTWSYGDYYDANPVPNAQFTKEGTPIPESIKEPKTRDKKLKSGKTIQVRENYGANTQWPDWLNASHPSFKGMNKAQAKKRISNALKTGELNDDQLAQLYKMLKTKKYKPTDATTWTGDNAYGAIAEAVQAAIKGRAVKPESAYVKALRKMDPNNPPKGVSANKIRAAQAGYPKKPSKISVQGEMGDSALGKASQEKLFDPNNPYQQTGMVPGSKGPAVHVEEEALLHKGAERYEDTQKGFVTPSQEMEELRRTGEVQGQPEEIYDPMTGELIWDVRNTNGLDFPEAVQIDNLTGAPHKGRTGAVDNMGDNLDDTAGGGYPSMGGASQGGYNPYEHPTMEADLLHPGSFDTGIDQAAPIPYPDQRLGGVPAPIHSPNHPVALNEYGVPAAGYGEPSQLENMDFSSLDNWGQEVRAAQEHPGTAMADEIGITGGEFGPDFNQPNPYDLEPEAFNDFVPPGNPQVIPEPTLQELGITGGEFGPDFSQPNPYDLEPEAFDDYIPQAGWDY